MQKYQCQRCRRDFESERPLGYCAACVLAYREQKRRINRAQNPAPGLCLDGRFVEPRECPRSFDHAGRQLCGLCGGDELEPGYGLGSGYGMGCYTFCCGCNTFLDFSEDES